MTRIEETESTLDKQAGTLAWSAALTRALGEPSEWTYDGKFPADAGANGHVKCACRCVAPHVLRRARLGA